LDGKKRKLLTTHGQHHPKADVDRLYVPRKDEGTGLIQLEEAHLFETMELMQYVETKADTLIQILRTHQRKINFSLV
jgi:hypothetical protein